MIRVRPPQASDLMFLTRYAIEHNRTRNDAGAVSETDRSRKNWVADRLFEDSDRRKLFVAEVGGAAVGYVYGVLDETRTATIKELFVDEFYRREGIGTALCQSVMSWARNHQVDKIYIDHGAHHPSTVLFFRAVGFYEQGTRLVYEEEQESLEEPI